MRIECALLCDSASVREGLLHLLGGGVTRIGLRAFPGPLSVDLGLVFRLTDDEAKLTHTVRADLVADASDKHVAAITFTFSGENTNPQFGDEGTTVAVAVPIRTMPIPEPGVYRIELHFDDKLETSLYFLAHEVDGLAESDGQPS